MDESTIVTLLFSQPIVPEDWQQIALRVQTLKTVHLFFLDRATFLLHEDFFPIPPGKRVYCAHSQQGLGIPPPADNGLFEAGGLANLGWMVRESHFTLSIPHIRWPNQSANPGLKKVGVILGEESHAQKEGIRLAAGLAGCNHLVTLYSDISAKGLEQKFPTSHPLLEALQAMNVSFSKVPKSLTLKDHSVFLQL